MRLTFLIGGPAEPTSLEFVVSFSWRRSGLSLKEGNCSPYRRKQSLRILFGWREKEEKEEGEESNGGEDEGLRRRKKQQQQRVVA